jgi:hypothetical protein
MGQRTLAFIKQMLRVFNFVELEKLDSFGRRSLTADSSKLGNRSQSIRDAQRIQTGTHKQPYTCIKHYTIQVKHK